MAKFIYQARDSQGRKLKGRVEAKSKQAAAVILREKQLFIISLREQSETMINEVLTAFSSIKQDDIVNITRQLATMINAGLPLLKAFSILENQSKAALRKVIQKLTREIEGGSNLGDALSKQADVFDRVYIALVQAGEAAGALDTVLLRLAQTLEKQKEFRSKTKGALIYPAIVVVAMLIVAVVMMIFVIPQMTSLYEDFNAELPLATQILMGISDFFVNQWYILLALTVGGIFAFWRWKASKIGRRQYDQLRLKIPVFGQLKQKVLATEFARTMSLMISSGISLMEALKIVGRGLDNVLYREAVWKARESVEKGRSLASALEDQQTFPLLVSQMIQVGEETGQLDEVLTKLADYYEQESEQAIKNLTTALEPMIMIVLGLGVGFLIVAIIMPIYNLTSQF